ncbi:monovalent cation/H+ antiporter complex subunit F [Rickettsiales bacterium]|nr:monovalent cation/H+ antiporter complex subunit F [Rickettsiales bacterium]
MLEGAIIAVLISMGMIILRSIFGPTIFDRILAVNSFGTNVVVLIAMIGHFIGTAFFLDVAITYALINFITTIALLRYFKFADEV